MPILLTALPNEILEIIIEHSNPKLPLMCSSPVFLNLGMRYLYRRLTLREDTQRPNLLGQAFVALSKKPNQARSVRSIVLAPKFHENFQDQSFLEDPVLEPTAAITDDVTTYLDSSGYDRRLVRRWRTWLEKYQAGVEYKHAFLTSLIFLLMPNLENLVLTVTGDCGPFNNMLAAIEGGGDAAAGTSNLGRLKTVRVVGEGDSRADFGYLLEFFHRSSIQELICAQLSSERPVYMTNFDLPLGVSNIARLELQDVQMMLVACSKLKIFKFSWRFLRRERGCKGVRFSSLQLYQALLSVSETLETLSLGFKFWGVPEWSHADAPDLSPMPPLRDFKALRSLRGALWLIFSCDQDAPISNIADKIPPNLKNLIITHHKCTIKGRTFTIPNLFNRLSKAVESSSWLKSLVVLRNDTRPTADVMLACDFLKELTTSRGVKLRLYS